MPATAQEDLKGKGADKTEQGNDSRPEMPQDAHSGSLAADELEEHPLPDEDKAKIVEK